MKICIDARNIQRENVSGISRYAKSVVKALIQEYPEHEYILFTNNFRNVSHVDDLMMGHKNVSTINYRIPNRLLDLTNAFFKNPKIDALIQADIFYSPHFNILSFKNPSRRILTVHDLSFFHFPDFFSWKERLWHARQAYGRQIAEAGHIVAVSDFTRNDIISTFHVPESRIVRMYSGIDPIYYPVKDEVRRSEFLGKHRLEQFILYVGALEPRKNISGLIGAFELIKTKRKFKDLELVIAGSPAWLYADIFRIANVSPHASSIRFWGKASEDDLRMLYATASVFSYPSFFEGFGFPPLEAQACGAPVVASNRSSLPEILGESAVLVDPWRHNEIAYALEAVLEETSLRDMLQERGFQNVKRFAWSKTVKELVQLFHSHA